MSAISAQSDIPPARALPTRVLIADCAKTNRTRLQSLLEKADYQVSAACNGEEALQRFRELRPEIVIVDVGLPEVDGYEVTRQIKSELEQGAFTSVLLVIGEGDDESILRRCVDSGADDFLAKPLVAPVLKAKLAALDRIRGLYVTAETQRRELVRYRVSQERDLRVAERVFNNVAHSSALQSPQLRHLHRAAATVNGDVLLAAPTVDGGLRLLVGDFTGHGLSAAIGAMPVSDVFYGMTRKGFPIADVVCEVNRKLRSILPTGHFLAGAFVEVDASSEALTVWNGGLPDILVCSRRDQGITHRLRSHHLPLGTVDNPKLDPIPQVIRIDDGDRVYIASDGLVEAESASGQRFGTVAYEACIGETKDPNCVFDAVVNALQCIVREREPSDDVTFVELRCERQRTRPDGAESRLGTRRPTNWRFELEFDAKTLKSGHPVPMLAPMLLEYERLGAHWSNISTVLSELYSNALEHGVLGLQSELKKTAKGFAEYYRERDDRLKGLVSGWVRLMIKNEAIGEKGRLIIAMKDSGNGFDRNAVLTRLDGNQTLSGRGIALVEALCKEVVYNERGNAVEVVYEWG
ncbi:MAG: fused response regulator/phosphatase [Pseudomonadota bacterium]